MTSRWYTGVYFTHQSHTIIYPASPRWYSRGQNETVAPHWNMHFASDVQHKHLSDKKYMVNNVMTTLQSSWNRWSLFVSERNGSAGNPSVQWHLTESMTESKPELQHGTEGGNLFHGEHNLQGLAEPNCHTKWRCVETAASWQNRLRRVYLHFGRSAVF